MCNTMGCPHFDCPPLCAECTCEERTITDAKKTITEQEAEIKYLAKNLQEIDEAANAGEFETYTAQQWIDKAKQASKT